MEETIKQEGEFKMSKPKKPKSLSKTDEIVRVEILDKPEEQQQVQKVIIPNETEDAIQEQSANESVLRSEQSKVELQTMGEGDERTSKNVIQDITDEEVKIESEKIEKEVEKHIQEQVNTGKPLPQNIEKLVSFMEETGGTIEDYIRLNTDYSNVDENTLLREYYKNTKPHLDKGEIEFLMEDNFAYDEDLDEERDIRKKKLAFKEEVAKAKKYLENVKDQYYDEIKLNSNVDKQYQEAYDFFNRYKKNEEQSKLRHEQFKAQTKNLFNNDFKGFEYNVGDKRFRYSVQNTDQIAENQSDIANFVGKFLDKDGNVINQVDYHKALYSAMNSDKIAQHFYEQGKADAVKEVINNSKNPIVNQSRQAPGEVFVNGFKVKSISGFDSSKLRIQTKKFNN